MIVSRQDCTSGAGDRTVVDPEVLLPYDMRTEAALLGVGLAGGRLRTELSASGEAWPMEGHDESEHSRTHSSDPGRWVFREWQDDPGQSHPERAA
jgi:hypothetical protein